jgi:hypothetical protein
VRVARAIAAVAAALIAARGGAAAQGQPVDVPALVRLVEAQPAGVERSAWKEQRRDAARRLGQSRDRRAVPALLKLAEAETFDIVGEIAIEGLGNLGDPAAAPVLQRIAADPARDRAQRELARKALAKLGAPPAGGGADPAPAGTGAGAAAPPGPAGASPAAGGASEGPSGTGAAPGTPPAAASSGGGAAPAGESPSALADERGPGGAGGAAAAHDLPALPADAIAASERLTISAGAASLGYDTVRERAALDADVAAAYRRRVERPQLAWGWGADARVVAGLLSPPGRAQTRGGQLTAAGDAELRYYVSPTLYVGGRAALGAQASYIADLDGDDPGDDLRDGRFALDAQVALLGGYGRVVDVGSAIRVRRLARALEAARALGRPIDAAVSRRLALTWWSLRADRSTYRALVATVAILREAGILLTEPDAGLTYELLAVLRDSQLVLRPRGLDLQLGVAESYLVRPGEIGDGSSVADEEGRVEQILFAAGYGLQTAADTLEIAGRGYGRVRVLAPAMPRQPSPWAVGATARIRRFAYGAHGDPLGAIDLAADLRLSNDDLSATGDNPTGLRIGGEVGYTRWLTQASGLRVSATAAFDSGELFLGAQIQATYGLLDVSFAGQ